MVLKLGHPQIPDPNPWLGLLPAESIKPDPSIFCSPVANSFVLPLNIQWFSLTGAGFYPLPSLPSSLIKLRIQTQSKHILPNPPLLHAEPENLPALLCLLLVRTDSKANAAPLGCKQLQRVTLATFPAPAPASLGMGGRGEAQSPGATGCAALQLRAERTAKQLPPEAIAPTALTLDTCLENGKEEGKRGGKTGKKLS